MVVHRAKSQEFSPETFAGRHQAAEGRLGLAYAVAHPALQPRR